MVLLAESGSLADTSFPALVLDLHRARFAGTVQVVRDRVEKAFLFQDGNPVFAESNLASESLGVQLMDAGQITRSDYARINRYVEKEECKEGQAMLDLELIEPRALFLALKDQVRARLLECFSWGSGTFRVEPSAVPPEETQPFRADIYPLLQEGVESHWSPDRILAGLERHMNQHAVRTSVATRIQHRLRSDDATVAFIDALDGSRTLWKALKEATTPRALATAWLLNAIGAIQYRDAFALEDEELFEEPSLEIVFANDSGSRGAGGAAAARLRPVGGGGADRENPAAAALREEVAEKFERLHEIDYYELLGVTRESRPGEIKRRYLNAAKNYHPDALARLHIDGEDRSRASKVFAMIGKAYAVLTNSDKRREYDASLASSDLGVDAEQIATAETLYRKGEILLRQGNFRGALEFLQPAAEIYPDESEYQSAAGWALYKKMPSEPELAKQHLEKAAELNPNDGVVLFRLGVVLRTLGETVAAANLLTRAREIDPSIS